MIQNIKKILKSIPPSLLILTYFHLSILLLFMVWRFFFLVYFFDDLLLIDFSNYIKSFLIGLRLDFIVSSFLSLPILFTVYIPHIGWNSSIYKKIISVYLISIFSFITIFCSINLEWFNEFGNHINTMIIMYGESKEGWTLILEEYNIFLYIISWIVITLCVFNIFKILRDKIYKSSSSIMTQFFAFILSFIITAILIRGGIQERPLDWGYAYFSSSNMANAAAQNPIFFFGRSYIEMKEEEKYNNQFLKIKNLDEVERLYSNLRLEHAKENLDFDLININERIPNIIIIILESFVSENCNFLNPNLKQSITPFLSELSNKGISFSNCFANGIRSAYGIGSILASWPVLPGKPIISQVESGFSDNALSKSMNVFPILGYNRTFLYGLDTNFDNMKGFCIANGFDEVIDRNHPKLSGSKDGTMWGIYDHIMLNHLIDIANSKKNNPFMITFFSTTNHDPFRIPEEYEKYFQDISTGNRKFLKAKKTMAYNDLILKEFFAKAKQEEWYENTIFIITADHGLTIHKDIPNHPRNGHIPFIIFSELLDNPQKIDKIVSQVDIMPTIIDLIGEDQYLSRFYGISGLKGGSGFACRVSNENLQWITANNLYYELMGKNKKAHFLFDSIWDSKYKKISSDDISEVQIESNAYIKNAYYRFKQNK